MHPVAFTLGSITVHWYGVLLAIGFLAGAWTASRRAPRHGVGAESVADLVLWLIVGAVVGARALYVISYHETLFKSPLFPNAPWTEVFMVQRGGLVYYGGLIGASLTCIIFCAWRHLDLWKMADVLAPSIALGYFFGRIGCLFNGCCFGKVCDLPWAIRFPYKSYAWEHQFAAGEVSGYGPSLPVHPTQVYDALLSLALYAVLTAVYRRTKFDGQVFSLYLMGYAAARSFVEVFRGDYTMEHLHGGLTPAHLVSMGIFVGGAVLYVVLGKRNRPRILP